MARKQNTKVSAFSLIFIVACCIPAFAQLSGIKNIPGDYPNISSAFAALNNGVTGGVCPTGGGVIFNVAAGLILNEAPLTLNIVVNKPTASAPIIFRKWGTGVDPVINITGTVAVNDAGIKLVGTDYTTFDGLSVNDIGVGAANWTEFGFALTRVSSTDGCQYVTIKNCVIDLAVINTSTTNGVYQANTDINFVITDPVSAAGIHFNNHFYNNQIRDVARAFFMAGGNLALSALSSFYDEGIEIGKKGGNTITFGGTTVTGVGIYVSAQKNAQIANNFITTGIGHASNSTYGIMITGGTDYNTTILNNTISVSSNTLVGATGLIGIYLTSHGSASAGTVDISSNIIENCLTLNGATSCVLKPLYSTGFSGSTGGALNIHDNIIRNNQQRSTTAGTSLFGMNFWNTSGAAIISIYSNQIYGNTSTFGFYGLDMYTGAYYNVYANEIHDNSNTSNYNVAGINTGANSATGNFSLHDNSIYNLTSSASGPVYGITTSPTNMAGTTGTNLIYNNTIYSLSSNGGGAYGMFLTFGSGGGNPNYQVYGNKIYSLSSTASSTSGIWVNAGTSGNIYNNFISDLQALNGNYIDGIYMTNNSLPYTVYNNSIYLNQTASILAGFIATGIRLYNCNLSPVDVRNNLVVNTSTPGAVGYTNALWAGWNAAPYVGYAGTSDYNSYNAGVPGVRNLIFYNEITPALDQTLAAFKVRVNPRDANSISAIPAFYSSTDLHTISGSIQNMGTFLAGFTTDVDGQPRSNPPDIGADEIYNSIDLGVSAVISPTSGSCFNPNASITFQIKNFSSLTHNFATNNATINYSASGTNTTGQIPAGAFVISAGTLAAGASTNVTVVAGTYNMSSGGTYIFDASITVAGGLDLIVANNALPARRTVTILPPVSATAGINPICSGSSTTLYASGASSYTWAPATYLSAVVGSSVTCTPLATTSYTITGTHANGCTSSCTLTIAALGASPLSGTYTIDNTQATDYPVGTNFKNFTDAIYALNCAGVNAPVVFIVISGQTFYASNMVITASGTAVNTITFQKSGIAHPTIYPLAGIDTYDGVFKLQGSDYITFDGIDIIENPCNTTTTAQLEWGYALLKNSITNGSQYNTIRNCVITLNKTNVNTKGIYGNNVTPASPAVQLGITNVSGANSYNTIYNNSISNSYNPLWIQGSSNAAYYDVSNEIGSAGTNTISNCGGAANTAYGLYVIYHKDVKIENNNIIVGPGTTGSVYGIYSGTGNGSTLINANTTSVFKSGTAGTLYGIYNSAADVVQATNITNNIIENCSYLGGTGAGYLWVFNNGGNASTLNYTGNISRNHAFACTANGSFWEFYNSAIVTNMNVSNNNFSNSTAANGGGGSFCGIWPQGTVTNLTISNNDIRGYSQTATTAQIWMYVMNLGGSAGTNTLNIFGNTISNCSNAYGPLYGIFSSAGTTTKNIYSNSISGFTTATNFSNVWGVFLMGGVNNNVYNNIIFNLGTTATGSPVRGINITTSTTSEAVYGNEIYNLSCSNTGGSVEGISTSSNPTTTKSIYLNDIYNLSTVTGVPVYGISSSGGATVSIFKNTVYTLSSATATGVVYGLNISGGTNVTASNNMIGNLAAPSSTNLNAINGINLAGGTSIKAYYNSVFFNAGSAGINFGTSGIYTSTVPTVELIGNLIVNTSTPNGTGITVAHRRSGTALGTFSASSDYNYYFTTPTPDATHLIFFDGTNSCQTIAAYKALVTPREQNSRWSNPGPVFISATDLHLPNNQQDSCVSDKGIPVAGITDDIDFDVRTATPDLGADEFILPLPVELLEFKAECTESSITLIWTTATETDNDHFTLERSSDANLWETIGLVPGSLSSNTLLQYSFTCELQDESGFYYRLQQTDVDGKTEIIGLIWSKCDLNASEGISLFPNPFTDNLQIQIPAFMSEDICISLYDVTGKHINASLLKNKVHDGNVITMQTAHLAAGIYYLKAEWHGMDQVFRVCKR